MNNILDIGHNWMVGGEPQHWWFKISPLGWAFSFTGETDIDGFIEDFKDVFFCCLVWDILQLQTSLIFLCQREDLRLDRMSYIIKTDHVLHSQILSLQITV